MSGRRLAGGTALALLYTAAFFALTHPQSRLFATHYWADLGDGLNGAWGLWWVRKAVVDLWQWPWHTTYLYHPAGISLHLHALAFANGLLALPLGALLGPVAVHNGVVLASFVLAGLTAFSLARAVTGSAAASVLAGYVFAFSSYHFAHTAAHMNLIAIQWIPLYLLCWLRLLTRASMARALAAALVLFAVYHSDYYYFAYCLLASGVLIVGEAMRRRRPLFVLEQTHRGPLALFAAVVALTSGAMLAALLRVQAGVLMLGRHDPRELSLDLLAPFVPGGHSYWAEHTTWFWRAAGGNINENSVFVGISTLALAACARRRGSGALAGLGSWWGLCALFVVLALGPRLHVCGHEVPGVLLPYGWLEAALPLVGLAGVPLRAFVMVTLALAVLVAAGTARLAASGRAGLTLAAALAGLIVIETLPGPIPVAAPPAATFADYLGAQEGTGALIDVTTPPPTPGVRMFLQTIHEKPMAYGYTSRTPAALVGTRARLEQLARAEAYRRLQCEYGFRWVLTDAAAPPAPAAVPVGLTTPGRTGILHDLERRFGPCPRTPS